MISENSTLEKPESEAVNRLVTAVASCLIESAETEKPPIS
jgi:hypothetical protein